MGSARSGSYIIMGRVEVIMGLHCSWLDINAITGTEVQGIVIEQISEVIDYNLFIKFIKISHTIISSSQCTILAAFGCAFSFAPLRTFCLNIELLLGSK